LLSIPFSLLHFGKRVRKVFILIVSIIFLEILLIKPISGYEPRYFYHWQFLSIILIVLPTTGLAKDNQLIKKFLPWLKK
jgi:hypothetical protein